jgi:uncharacterized RDD family membrane protein YckC
VSPPTAGEGLRLQGHYAGIVSRLAGFVIDVLTIALLFALAGQVIEYLVRSLAGNRFTLSESPVASTVALIAWAFFYCAYPLAVAGRTFGMSVLGLRALRRDGTDLRGGHAVIRVLAFPLSFLLFGFGFILILLNRDRRALHDLIAGTVVVYAWDARAARLRFLAKPGSE